jgi:hypothetical protein
MHTRTRYQPRLLLAALALGTPLAGLAPARVSAQVAPPTRVALGYGSPGSHPDLGRERPRRPAVGR